MSAHQCLEAYAISTVFQPFRPSYQELYERVIALESATGVSPVQSTAQLTSINAGDNNADS